VLPNLCSLIKLRVSRDRCQPFEITGFPPDFNNLLFAQICGQIRGASIQKLQQGKPENSFAAYPKTLFRFGIAGNQAQAGPEDSSKIKDRLEALLFAETLQGTLSPNANPGKGSIGGLLNLMPRAPARIQRKAQRHRFTCPRLDLLYQSERDCARGEQKKLRAGDSRPAPLPLPPEEMAARRACLSYYAPSAEYQALECLS
jgi:hypothetical protein